MPNIYSFKSLLPFSNGEKNTKINNVIHLLSDSYVYDKDQTVATFYANVPAHLAGDKLVINLVKDGTLLTSQTVAGLTRFSFLADISDLKADDYSVEIYPTTIDLIGGDTFNFSVNGILGENISGFVGISSAANCTAKAKVIHLSKGVLSSTSACSANAKSAHLAKTTLGSTSTCGAIAKVTSASVVATLSSTSTCIAAAKIISVSSATVLSSVSTCIALGKVTPRLRSTANLRSSAVFKCNPKVMREVIEPVKAKAKVIHKTTGRLYSKTTLLKAIATVRKV